MAGNKKQLKITTLFRKDANAKLPDGCVEQHTEVQLLEQKVRDKQNELYELQRQCYRKKALPPKKKDEPLIRPQNIILGNYVESLERKIKLLSMLTGVEVQSYVENEYCCVVYHMQHKSENLITHGLRIDMKSGDNLVSKLSFPVGFNIIAILEDFENIMMPECLVAIRRGLVAYYDRIEQFKKLKKLFNIEAEMFKVLDGSHIEVSFFVQDTTEEEDDQFNVTLLMDYGIYDIRPKKYYFKESVLPEGASEVLKAQCSLFKRKPLPKAFKEAFLNDFGTYKIVRQLGPRPENKTRKPKKFKPNKQNYNNDDTFHPEECSDQSEDDIVEG